MQVPRFIMGVGIGNNFDEHARYLLDCYFLNNNLEKRKLPIKLFLESCDLSMSRYPEGGGGLVTTHVLEFALWHHGVFHGSKS